MASGVTSKVILDTNSLIYSLKQKADISDLLFRLTEVAGVVVPKCVLHELESMSRDVMFAKGALALASRYPTIEGDGPADDCILELAVENGYFILTNDRELLRRARKEGVRTLSFMGRKRIDFS